MTTGMYSPPVCQDGKKNPEKYLWTLDIVLGKVYFRQVFIDVHSSPSATWTVSPLKDLKAFPIIPITLFQSWLQCPAFISYNAQIKDNGLNMVRLAFWNASFSNYD